MGKSYKEKGNEEKGYKEHKLGRKEDKSCLDNADIAARQNGEIKISVTHTEKKNKEHICLEGKSVSELQAQGTTDFLEPRAETKKNAKKRKEAGCILSLECIDVENNAHCSGKDSKIGIGKEAGKQNSLALNCWVEHSPKKKKHKKDRRRDQNFHTECVTEKPGRVIKKRSRIEGLEQTMLSGKETCEQRPLDAGPVKKQKKSRHRHSDFPEQQPNETLATDLESTEQQEDAISGAAFGQHTVQCQASGEVIGKANIQDDLCEAVASKSMKKKKKHSKGDGECLADLKIMDSGDSVVGKEMVQERKTSKKKKSKKSKKEKRLEEHVMDLKIPSSAEHTEGNEEEQAGKESKKKKSKKSKKEKRLEEHVMDLKIPSSAERTEGNEEEQAGKKSKKKKSKKPKDVSISCRVSAEMEVVASETCDKDDKSETMKKAKKHKALNSKEKIESGDVCVLSLSDDQISSSSCKVKKCENGDTLGKIHPRNAVEVKTDAFGQWNTQMFENSERQTKFLRLLGGFKNGTAGDARKPEGCVPQKKGLFGSLKPSQSSLFGGNRAASCGQASEMNSRLETDFTNALSYSLGGQRGKGLGYQPDPAAGKRFHIDVNKCSSKKFDD